MADVVKTTADMMQRLEDEIAAVKDGTLEPEKARLVLRGRGIQIKTAELNLQYMRMQRGKGTATNAPAPLVGLVDAVTEALPEKTTE